MPEVVTSVARANGLPVGAYVDETPGERSPIGSLYEIACAYESWAAASATLTMEDRMGDAAAFAAAARACAGPDASAARIAVGACQAILDLHKTAGRSTVSPVILARRAPRHGARTRS